MKKILFFVSALAGLFLAGSCQREELEPVGENGVVTFEVSIPEAMTKTIGDDVSNINQLVYDVYWTDASIDTAPDPDDLTLLYKGNASVYNGATSITVELMNDKNYVILFWAQRDNTWGFATEGNLLKNGVNFPDSFAANAENIEAFSSVEYLSKNNLAAKTKSITLKRPFAQINLGSLLAANFDIVPTTSSMIVRNAGASFDVINQVAVDKKTVEFTAATVPGGKIKTDYTHVGMNYIFANGNVEVDYALNTEAGITVTNTVSNVPVAANYRTNIIGKLFTSEAGYSITLEGWGDAGKDMEVITEGLVKNINGDYEITNENGLAYAINNLFAQGGDFYLTADLYDMTDYDVTSPSVPEGVVLNIYGETPVVTRAATSGVVTIIGLKGSVIETNNGTVSFNGIKIDGTEENGDIAAFIETNNGSADFTGCETTTQDYIGENTGTVTESDNTTNEDNDIVAEENGESLTKVATADELVAALEAGSNVFFMNDIRIDPASMSNAYGKTGINVKVGQTIDGNGKTLNIQGAGGTWDSGINTTGGVIKNITVTGSFRGIFINHTSDHSEKVVLENVTIGGNGTVYTISCDQGLYQGIEAINCTFNGWTSFAATAGDAKFVNCSFGEGSGYAYCRPYSNTEFVNCTFCSGYAVDTTRATVTFTDCIWEVSNADDLVAALEAGFDVTFTNDIKIDPASMSNAYGATGINVKSGQTIDGNGYTLNIQGAGGTWDSGINTTGGVIKNITVTGSFRGIFINHTSDHSEKVVLENVTIGGNGTVYTISCDQGLYQGIEAINCTFNGWTSFAATAGDAKFVNCSFGEGSGYAYCRPYAPTSFVGCDFEDGYQMDPRAAVTIETCTLGDVALTTSNLTELVISNLPNVTIEGKIYCNSAITDMTAVCYKGEVFESGSMDNALWLNNYIFDGEAAIVVENKTYSAIVIENCNGNFKDDVISIKNDNSSVMILQNLDFTLTDDAKLIVSTNPLYQVFMSNITINGEKMTQETIAKYLENVEWYQVVEEI